MNRICRPISKCPSCKISKAAQITITMCGRYTLVKKPISIGKNPAREIRYAILSNKDDSNFQERYNIAPTQDNLVIRKDEADGALFASNMRWGLIPSWSRTGSTQSLLINARSETIADKPSFKAAYRRRRCLVPGDGYYEWMRARNGNQPYYFQLNDEAVFYMAGIWESWYDDVGKATSSYAILTTQANALAAKTHDRMPVILEESMAIDWLEDEPDRFESERRIEFFNPLDPSLMKSRPVNPAVNNNQNEGPACIEAPPIEASTQLDMGF